MKIAGKEYKTIWFHKNVVKITDKEKKEHKEYLKNSLKKNFFN